MVGDDGWPPVAARVFAFSVLPVLLAALHVRLDTAARERLWKVEVYLIYLFMLGVGASGLSGFFGHVFTPDAVAESGGRRLVADTGSRPSARPLGRRPHPQEQALAARCRSRCR